MSDPQLSPDGRSVLVVVTRPDFTKDVYRQTVVRVDVATSKQTELTARFHDVSFERWSPDGSRMAFLAGVGSGDSEVTQLFVMRLADETSRQLTFGRNDVGQFAWRPDGRAIAFVTADAAPHRAPFDDAFVVGSNDYLTTSRPTPVHIWLARLDGSEPRQLTFGPGGMPSMTPPYSLPSPLSWSADGRSIVFARMPSAYEDDAYREDLRVLDVASGAVRKLTSGVYQEMPMYSPDGSRIAFAVPREGDYNQETQMFVVPSAGGAVTPVTAGLGRNVIWSTWLNSKALLVGADAGPRTSMWIVPLSGAPRMIDIGDLSVQTAAESEFGNWIPVNVGANGAIAFTATRAGRPNELYYLSSPSAVPVRLTDVNAHTASLGLGRQIEVRWTGPNGFAEDGILTYPVGYVSGKKYPMVLIIHGGPIASSALAFSELDQLFAARGFLTFEPNYRGSDNLGNDYERAIARDAGEGPGKDVMAGIAAVGAMGMVDTSRIGVSGWSYGGFMTSWMIGNYHIWKAAVDGAAVTDWFVDYSLADDQSSDWLQLRARPWSGGGYADYVRQSPMTYAQAITTPTLIMCDTGDVRVPIPESYELYHALRDNHVPVQFVAYPVSGHLPSDPVRNADIDRRWVDWIVRWLK